MQPIFSSVLSDQTLTVLAGRTLVEHTLLPNGKRPMGSHGDDLLTAAQIMVLSTVFQ